MKERRTVIQGSSQVRIVAPTKSKRHAEVDGNDDDTNANDEDEDDEANGAVGNEEDEEDGDDNYYDNDDDDDDEVDERELDEDNCSCSNTTKSNHTTSNSSSSGGSNGSSRSKGSRDEDIPLYLRLQRQSEHEIEESSSLIIRRKQTSSSMSLKRKCEAAAEAVGRQQWSSSSSSSSKHDASNAVVDDDGVERQSNKKSRKTGRTNKNAPAVMKSNKPVRRLRIDADNSTRKFRDPRFVEGSGKMDYEKFYQAYSFLDGYQEREIEDLSKAMKKIKNDQQKGVLKTELLKRKQELTERRRNLRVKARLQEAKSEEMQKVKQGVKKPFFMKRSAQKEMALEEKYADLKKTGKLSDYLQKKRKRNASKDRRSMPLPR